jgi:hypothetical protein
VEFDAANNLVWKWEDHNAAGTVTNVLTFETGTTGLGTHAEGYFRNLAAAGPHVMAGNVVFGKTGSPGSVSGSSPFPSENPRFLADGRTLPGWIPAWPAPENRTQVLRR